jgi:hypothetical protein
MPDVQVSVGFRGEPGDHLPDLPGFNILADALTDKMLRRLGERGFQ